jgi:hypothetical protein
MIGVGLFKWRGGRRPAPAAPTILSVALSPLPATAGAEIACIVNWTGYPRTGVSYRWQLDDMSIGGATGSAYVPLPTDVGGALTCEVSIDNGAGTDAAESDPFPVVGVGIGTMIIGTTFEVAQ